MIHAEVDANGLRRLSARIGGLLALAGKEGDHEADRAWWARRLHGAAVEQAEGVRSKHLAMYAQQEGALGVGTEEGQAAAAVASLYLAPFAASRDAGRLRLSHGLHPLACFVVVVSTARHYTDAALGNEGRRRPLADHDHRTPGARHEARAASRTQVRRGPDPLFEPSPLRSIAKQAHRWDAAQELRQGDTGFVENPRADMATVGRVAGARVSIFLKDHPPPHVHVSHQGSYAKLDIATGVVMAGQLPQNVLRAVQVWIAARQTALLAEWNNAQAGRTPNLIP